MDLAAQIVIVARACQRAGVTHLHLTTGPLSGSMVVTPRIVKPKVDPETAAERDARHEREKRAAQYGRSRSDDLR